MTQLQQRELERHDMWCHLIDDYEFMTKNQRKKAKFNYAKTFGLFPNQIGDTSMNLATNAVTNFCIDKPIEYQQCAYQVFHLPLVVHRR